MARIGTILQVLNKTENRLILSLSLILAGVSLLVRFSVIFLQKEGHYQKEFLLVALIFIVMMILWGVMHFIRNWPILILIFLGPFLAMVTDSLHTEIYFLVERGTFSWVGRQWILKNYIYFSYLGSLIFFTWILGYLTITNYFSYRNKKLTTLMAREKAHRAAFESLRYKLNPHFLFNTLNSISSLILDGKNHKADQLIDRLSHFLRYSLDKTPMTKVTVSQDMNVLENYIDIERVRFSDRFHIEYQIDKDIHDCLVPTLFLYPVIECVIRKMVETAKTPITLSICAHANSENLEFVIKDNGTGLIYLDTHNDGLEDLRNRLIALYGDKALLHIAQTPEHGCVFQLAIPLERAQNQSLHQGILAYDG